MKKIIKKLNYPYCSKSLCYAKSCENYKGEKLSSASNKIWLIVLFAVLLLSWQQECLISFATREKKIAITFDDGPHSEYTAEILDTLKKYNVPATFFVIGSNADLYPELIRREMSEGHEIGNHTYYHRHISAMDEKELKEDLMKNEERLISLTGVKPTLFRPPEGVCNDSVKRAAKDMGYSIVMWTVDTNDWQGIESCDIVNYVKHNVKPGSIILFHDYVSGKSGTPAAVDMLIPYLLNEGYTFVTVSELNSG